MRRFWFRHPERWLAVVSLAAWAMLIGISAEHQHGSYSGLRMQGEWMLMVVAMMVPPALPMARHVAKNSLRVRRQRAAFLFMGSSLLLWVGAGLVAGSMMTLTGATGHRRWLLGGSLLLAAVWELTPAKKTALKACHRTIPLPPQGQKADRAVFKLGVLYGKSCFRACWALMLPMALAGHVGITLMLTLTGIAVAEEVLAKGYRLAPAAAVLLTVAGLMVLVLG